MSEYTITLTDVKKYLSTVPYGATVGIPQHNYDCLLGKVLQQKYPGKLNYVGGDNRYVYLVGQIIETPEEVVNIASKFDGLWENWGNGEDYDDWEPVTLATLRDSIPELFS